MPNIIEKYVHEKEDKGIIIELFESGLKKSEIEDFIFETYKPYLKSKSISRVQVYAYMSQYIDSLMHITSYKDCKLLFEKCIEVFWEAKEKDPVLCYKSYQYWQEDVTEATSKIVTMFNIDRDRNKMKLHEFAEDVFTKIGKIIEKCIQPYLRILLYLEKVVNNEKPTPLYIKKLDLGSIVKELIKFETFNDLLIPPPWNLQLNDWRNIEKHDKYLVKNNKIMCKYKKPPKEKEILLYQPELWKLFLYVNDIFSILRLAHSIFFLDNMDEIKPYWENTELREESSILDLINCYNTFGFSVKKYSTQTEMVKFALKELTINELNTRLEDLFFLIRPTWYKARKRYINLEYYDYNDNLTFVLDIDTSKRKDIFTDNVNEKLLTIENIKECVDLKDFEE